MADIKLGLSGSEVTLPVVNSILGSPAEMPVGYNKQVDKATMLDGSTRFNNKSYSPRTFSLAWAMLTAAEIATIQALVDLNVKLHYQNNWYDATWRWVNIMSFKPGIVVYLGTLMYSAALEMEEVL